MIGKKLTPFKFWCQKVLPTVYDDSLSYYEYLGKLNEYLNEVIEQINTLTEAEEDFQEDLSAQWTAYKNGLNTEWVEYKTGLTAEWNAYRTQLTEAWTTTKNYIDNYFDNLDVQNEIDNKLDAMVLDGTITSLLEPIVSTDIPSIVTSWLNENVDPVGSAVVVDESLSISGAAADAKATGEQIKNIRDNMLKADVTYPNSGYINTSGAVVTNANFFYSDFIPVESLDINAYIYTHPIVATFTFYDANHTYLNEYVKTDKNTAQLESLTLSIPDDAVYVRVCTDPTYANQCYTYVDISDKIIGTKENYGNDGTQATNFITNFLNFTVCPCKKVTKAGKITSLYVKSYSSGTTRLYVGTLDQYLLFIPRATYEINVNSGEQNIDVSNLNIYIEENEQVVYKFIGQTPFIAVSGSPTGDNSFYYALSGTLQLTEYGDSTKSAIFGFGFEVTSSTDYEQDAEIRKNTNSIHLINNNISELQSNLNVISDRNGNKYKMIVENGDIVLLPMNFSHVLCVGNSYTIHPTVDDTEPDYANDLWWGHWAMASSTKDTSWTSLLQTALRQKINNAKVTPVFGRRYETAPAVYNLDNANTFTYWNGSAWVSLSDNLSNFTDVDAVVIFLGVNYGGNDWYTLYKALVEKFLTWFPNASLFCCSCSYFSKTENDNAIQRVANEYTGTYINLVGVQGLSKLGSYVKGDDNLLHQIDNSGVSGHFGDYGEYNILDRVCNAIGYENNANLYDVSISNVSGVVLTSVSSKTTANSIVSIFAETSGVTLSSITVTSEDNSVITVTDHGTTDYGRVFTFVMPASNVTVVPSVS